MSTHPSQSPNSLPEPYVSSLPELKLPAQWNSSIPDHLLINADPQTKWIMETLSKNSNATEFACQAAVTHNIHLRLLNGKTFKNESAAAELREELNDLKEQAAAVSTFTKPLGQFANLWQYTAFRWMVYIALLFIITYVYPAYVAASPNLVTILFKMLGIQS